MSWLDAAAQRIQNVFESKGNRNGLFGDLAGERWTRRREADRVRHEAIKNCVTCRSNDIDVDVTDSSILLDHEDNAAGARPMIVRRRLWVDPDSKDTPLDVIKVGPDAMILDIKRKTAVRSSYRRKQRWRRPRSAWTVRHGHNLLSCRLASRRLGRAPNSGLAHKHTCGHAPRRHSQLRPRPLKSRPLLDHLIRPRQHRRGDRQDERLRGLLPFALRLSGDLAVGGSGAAAFRTSSTTSCHQCSAGTLSSPSSRWRVSAKVGS